MSLRAFAESAVLAAAAIGSAWGHAGVGGAAEEEEEGEAEERAFRSFFRAPKERPSPCKSASVRSFAAARSICKMKNYCFTKWQRNKID